MRVQEYSPKHIRENIGVVRWLFDWLEDRDFIVKSPIRKMKPIKVPRKLPKVPEVADVMKLIEHAKKPRERTIIELLYGSGLRKSELLGINLDDLMLSRLKILIRGKGAKERLQPITRHAAQAIADWLPERAANLAEFHRETEMALLISVGGRTRGRRLGGTGLLDLVHELADRAAIPYRVYNHLLRHAYGTHLIEGGANLEEVQELMDHANIMTTRIYVQLSKEKVTRAFERAHPRA